MRLALLLLFTLAYLMPAHLVPAHGQSFREVQTDLEATVGGALTLADFDNDGLLDILIVGDRIRKNAESILYRNEGVAERRLQTSQTEAVFAALTEPSAAPGDYDNDGDLDLLLTGRTDSDDAATFLYRNDGNFAFEQVNTLLPGLDQGGIIDGFSRSRTAWGDYDNDGDLDLLLTGESSVSGTTVTNIYRNDGGDQFERVTVNLPRLASGSVDWGDYDNDGDLDLLISSSPIAGTAFTSIFRNEGADRFVNIEAGLPGFGEGSASWGDYDSDGDLDVLILEFNEDAGATSTVNGIYRNEGSAGFRRADLILPNAAFGAWADFDNDGKLDLLHASLNASGILRNTENANDALIQPLASFPGLLFADLAVGDLDNDGRLDVVTMGDEWENGQRTAQSIVRAYRNEINTSNQIPTPPTNIFVDFDDTSLVILWEPGSDAETAPEALTYNISVGTAPGLSDIRSPATTSAGHPLLPGPGNMGHARRLILRDLDPSRPYFVQIQSVDSGFLYSEAAEAQLIPTSAEPTADLPVQPALLGNYPNPFNPATTIRYQLSETGPVRLTVYDVLGNEIAVLVDGVQAAGTMSATWNGRDTAGHPVASGIYLYRLEAGTHRLARTMMLLK